VQTFEGTDYDCWFLIVDGAGVGVAAYSEVLVRTAAVLVANVTLAHIACHDKDFHGWVKETCLAPRHDVPLAKGTNQSCSPQRTVGGKEMKSTGRQALPPGSPSLRE
jgi:hypothetical protein